MKRASSSPATRSWACLRRIWLPALVLCLTTLPALAGPVEITDDLGRQVRLAAPAKRIVALYGAFNEMLDGMALTERITARTQADELPASILDRPVIGTHMRPNVEMIVALKPDLVLQMGGRAEAAAPLRDLERFGLTTAFFEARSFAELFSVLQRLGVLCGEPGRAATLEQSLRSRLEAVARVVDGDGHSTVLFEIRYPNLLAAGRGSMIDDVIRAAGGKNAVPLDDKLARLSEEEVFRLDPDAYVLQRGPMNRNPVPPGERPNFKGLRAVRQGRVLVVDELLFSRPGPRNVEAVETLARFLHPGRFQDGGKGSAKP
ncbi:MAG: ABC transporter substrate-binding protein [Desulfovibrio aminophilus]|jgi:iron complex transport system substrate-binding protein|uniref:ABC transporter substrate-binding protein n=1 Tax=Desulfovibrio aminophilus TaxID=81425 RepID=UPI0039EA7038